MEAKRKIRNYKSADIAYFKAMTEMLSKGKHLSTFLEQVVIAISEGRKVIIHKSKK